MSLVYRGLVEEEVTFRAKPLPYFPATKRHIYDCVECCRKDTQVMKIGSRVFCAECLASHLGGISSQEFQG